MQNENNNTQPLPLYKVLDEQRTQGIFIVDGDMIISTDNPETYPKSYNDGIVIFENATNENTTDSSIVAHFAQHTANKKYTALAVNNLVSLAEALNDMVKEFDSYAVPVTKYPEVKATIKKAKEALQRIS